MANVENTMMGSYRVLDLTDEKGFLCGKILADLGMDVLKIEPVGGDLSRRCGPFYKDIPKPEFSLYWLAFNCNKRGITLDISKADGKALFKKLVRQADFVIESFPPGTLAGLGLGYDDLQKINPRIILTSITPFGQDGPYRNYKVTDLISTAIGGTLYVNGLPDREPIRYGFPVAYAHAASEAAVATLIAHVDRERSGQGQSIDVSIHQTMLGILHNALQIWEMEKTNQNRTGIFYRMRPEPSIGMPAVWQCKDGYVSFILFGGQLGERSNYALIKWMDQAGMCPPSMKQVKWEELDLTLIPQEIQTTANEAISKFFMSLTKEELYKGCMQRRIFLFPVSDPGDIVKDIQLKERKYWVQFDQKEIGEPITYLGPFVKASRTPLQITRPAPAIGEHNIEIYEQELGLSRQDLILLKESGTI